MAGMVRLGLALFGEAGRERLGSVGMAWQASLGKERLGTAGHGRLGMAWQVPDRQGTAG